MKYIQIPVLWEDPIPEDFEIFVGVLDAHPDKKIFVHCAANMRVSVFIALYRILQLGWESDLAFVDVHEIWEPNECWVKFIDEVLGKPKLQELFS